MVSDQDASQKLRFDAVKPEAGHPSRIGFFGIDSVCISDVLTSMNPPTAHLIDAMQDYSNPMLPKRFHELLDYRLFMIYRDCSEVAEGTCRAEFGVRGRLWRILATVVENDSSTVNQLAEFAELDVFQTSRAVGRLVRLGLIKRGARPGNGRFAQISPTTKGSELYQTMFARYAELNGLLLDALSPEMVDQLVRILVVLGARAKLLLAEKSSRAGEEVLSGIPRTRDSSPRSAHRAP